MRSPTASPRPVVRYAPFVWMTLAVLAFACPTLSAQNTATATALTVINDAAWGDSAGGFEVARARSHAHRARLSNVSIRAHAGTGTDTLIAGAVVQGRGELPVLVRAIGPGLARFGVTNALRNPKLEIFRGESLVAQTNTATPTIAAASAYVGAFPLLGSPPGLATGDAALLGSSAAGFITAHCSSESGAGGVALLEFYDGSAAPAPDAPRFVNLSSRARVETGESIIVIGFIVAGEGSTTLLLRGIGETLAQFGVDGALRDPAIELYAGRTRIAGNDNWQTATAPAPGSIEDAQRAVGAFALSSSNDAALLVTLSAGAYTLQVRGAAGQTGVALAEIHEVFTGDFDVAHATNATGLDVYRRLTRAAAPDEDVIISPYSIQSALALAYAGADGETRTEMARVLGLPLENAPLQVGFGRLRRSLEQIAEDSHVLAETRTRSGTKTDPIEWAQANRLFGQHDYPFRESFLTLMRDGFAAPLELLDFPRDPEGARTAINGWVEGQTRQRIQELIPRGEITALTRLVLVNALHLKAPWDTPFDKAETAPRRFRPATGSPRNVPTMHRTGSMGHTSEGDMTVVSLDYLGGGLQFLVLLPHEGISIDAAAAALTPAHFARWARLGESSRKLVSLFLPKFEATSPSLELVGVFASLGLRTAFDLPRGSANFDGIAPRRGMDYLYISAIFHKTFVAVAEESTEAAAATAVLMAAPASAAISVTFPIEVRVDRPFLFALQHRSTGTCLFIGRIMNPR